MSVFSHPDFDDHEGVYAFTDPATQMRAIIAVHSTKLGPAGGGTRFWSYTSNADALTDVLRLSRAMSYKNAMAGLELGGGKAVVLRPEGAFDREALFESYGRAIEKVGGQYITAEDVGVSPSDMQVIKSQTDYVAGLNTGKDASGDPSPVTARGVFYGMQTAVKERLNKNDFKGLSVAVQGLGHVGYALCQHLHDAGAMLIVTDINTAVLKKAKDELGATIVEPDVIHSQAVDIFAPCALGGAVNAKTIEQIQASIVAGAANNQLETRDMGAKLAARNILYCPDYVLNAGGIINVAAEVRGDYDPDWVEAKVLGIQTTLTEIFARRDQGEGNTAEIADEMARERLK